MQRRLVGFFVGIFAYLVWPACAALAAYERTDALFRAKLVPLPFEAFGALVAAGTFCFALSFAVLIVGLFKPQKGKDHETPKDASSRIDGARTVDARVGG